MDNQHRKIKGYRELNQDEINHMNLIKEKGVELDTLITSLKAIGAEPRWLAIGTTDLQKGLMALTRSVAKSEYF